MKTSLIDRHRVTEENLEWKDVQIPCARPYKDERRGTVYTPIVEGQLIDATGTVYHAILEEDGRVTTPGGEAVFDSVETYEGFGAAEPAGISKRFGRRRTSHELYIDNKTRRVFVRASHPSVCEEDFYSIDAFDLVGWLSDIDNREEPIIYEDEPRSVAIGLPIGIINTIERMLPGSSIDWIRCILAEALGNIALAGPPVWNSTGGPAFSADEIREALAKIKSGKMAA
jgi:hypothetical protein